MTGGPMTALSTNNSDTSQFMNTSSAGGASFQVSGSSISFASHSRDDSSLINTTSNYDQSYDVLAEAEGNKKKNRRGAKEVEKSIKNNKK